MPEPASADAAPAPDLLPPLAGLSGAEPPMPEWARAAIDAPHERASLDVAGAAIEWLAWGARGRPGLLLLHGNGAHADWWRFTAPILADGGLRVAALSWSGMGGSDHRARYTLELFVDEALAVAEAAGLGPCFTVVAHSFGGVPAAALASRHSGRVARAIIIDTPFGAMRPRDPASAAGRVRAHRIYPTLDAALARFRWAPVQPTVNLWAADFIARRSLKLVAGGYTWRFDPMLWQNFRFEDPAGLLAAGGAPLDYVWGDRSALVTSGVVDRIRAMLPPSTRMVGIPNAHHHVMADQPLALVAAVRALVA